MIKTELPLPTAYQMLQCDLFTHHVYETNEELYKARGSSSQDKIKADIRNGKYAECMVFNLLELNGLKPSPIDFTIYPKKRKSFDADIVVEGLKFHVKSCQDGGDYPNSWLFQKSDSLFREKLPGNVLALCVMKDDGASYAYSCSIDEVTFREPIAFPLKRTKVAVYEEDLITQP